jgi:hypothetical protein
LIRPEPFGSGKVASVLRKNSARPAPFPQFERAFYNRRLPAWGLHNQTVIVLMAALAQNALDRHTWQRAIDRQHSPTPVAA